MKLRLALLPFLVVPAQAQEVRGVPTELFGIGLGSVYEYPSPDADENAVGTFPVKRLVSERLSLHRGLSLYFEPLTENEAFPFREIAAANSNYPTTSYRLHVFPVIPRDAVTLSALQGRNLPQTVTMIEWSRGNSELKDGDGYTWARGLCKSMEADLGIAPKITDSGDKDIYRCVFSSGERELEVSSAVGQTIQLSLSAAVSDPMDAEVHSRMRRLEREEARRKRLAQNAVSSR